MVFSSQRATASSAERWKRSPSIGTSRGSTSQYSQNFSQHTWTFAPITRLGLPVRPSLDQRRLNAIPASMQASEEPVVEQPMMSAGSGAFHRSARMATQRRSSSAVCGYSSLSIMFLSEHSAISSRACGSIQVVTKVARLSRALPSSISSSRTSCNAVSAGSAVSSSRSRGGVSSAPSAGFMPV
jgi:hypothetical protein